MEMNEEESQVDKMVLINGAGMLEAEYQTQHLNFHGQKELLGSVQPGDDKRTALGNKLRRVFVVA